ncbi:MAG TPA: hypothetical protein DCL77_08970 [Prolixibacteraceae bacterium]|jgi:hypothetical protein|nr:hypothetical protein [Prolixibacteraceae bacterium]
MNYNTISSQAVIAKIYRDLKPRDSAWEVDAIEWIGEALEFIGGFYGLELKEMTKRVVNFRADLPPSLFELVAVKSGDRKLPYEGKTLQTFSRYKDYIFRTDPTAKDFGFTQVTESTDAYYFLQPGYIKTSFEQGTIRIQYLAFPVDSQGYPEVPDNIYVTTALWWYIVRQMLMGGYESNIFRWETADYNWKKYCVSAGNDMMMPNPERMEAFKEKWIRLLPFVKAQEASVADVQEDLLDVNPRGEIE